MMILTFIYMLTMLNYLDIYPLVRIVYLYHLQDDINELSNWSDEWLIKLNINKCKVVSYGRNIDCNYSYHINDVPLI